MTKNTRYAIWDKETPIITPSGAVFTADEWMERYPVAKLPNVTILCARGEMNGGFFGTLGSMKDMYEADGCDFSDCTTDESVLDKMQEFDDQRAAEIAAKEPEVSNEAITADALASIAASLEYQNMMSLDDTEV